MKNITYKIKKITAWVLNGDFKTMYGMLMRYNRFAYCHLDDNKGYQKWFKQHKPRAQNVESLPYKPLISVLLIVTDKRNISSMESILKQSYSNWQLCLATNQDIPANNKIKLIKLPTEGKQGSTLNNLLKIAKGEYLMLLKEGGVLDHSALSAHVSALNNKRYKLIYADEDRIDDQGKHIDPFFKPDFSPNLLYSLDYISRGALIQTAAVKAVGGFDIDLKYGHGHDLALKVIQDTKDAEVHHIPQVLYHSSFEPNAEPIPHKISEYLGAKVETLEADKDRVFYRISSKEMKKHPKISIIIPTKDKVELLRTCITSIKEKTTYLDYEIIVVDNQSSEPDALAYLSSLKGKNIQVIKYDKPYNYSAVNNYALAFAKGEIICFLNNDVEIISNNWLEEMMLWMLRPGVGAVGAKLYYPGTGNIQHAGMHCVTNPYTKGDYITHGYINQPGNTKGYLNELYLAHEASSVTGACLLMRKDLFTDVGWFDEENTPTSYSDVDLCFRIRKAGYSIMWTPHAELYHYESASRGLDIERSKAGYDYMIKTWPQYFGRDVHVNPNLSLYYKGYPVLVG